MEAVAGLHAVEVNVAASKGVGQGEVVLGGEVDQVEEVVASEEVALLKDDWAP